MSSGWSSENSTITKEYNLDKNDKVSKNRKSAAGSKKRGGTSSASPLDLPDLSTEVKRKSAKNAKKIIEVNSESTRREKKSLKNREKKDLFSSSSSFDAPSAKNTFSATGVQKNIPASTDRNQIGRGNNCQTKGDENVEKESFHEKMSKSSWKEKFDKILESSNNVEDDFTRDVEVTREALPIINDISHLEEPLSPRPQYVGWGQEAGPKSPKEEANAEYIETTGAEFANVDQNDDESGELHVRLDNLRTYPPRRPDVIYIGTRVLRIVKRTDDFFRTFEKSLVTPPLRQTQSPPKVKFHPSDNYRANQLWDEFVSNNPEIFARNTSSNLSGTNEQQTRKRKFFKTDRNTRLGLDKTKTEEAPVPAKNKNKSGSKRARKIKSSSSAPEMVTNHGLDFRVEDRNVYEISSDSESAVFPRNSFGKTRRSRTARDRYDRSTEIEERSDEASIEDFPYRSRSQFTRRKQERTKQSTEKRSQKPINEDRYRSQSPDRRSSVTRSSFDDRVENQSTNFKEETATVKDRRSKRKVNEASSSRSVTAKDRGSKRMRIEDRMENWSESEIMRSSEVRDEAATAKNRHSKRKINEASRSRSVSGNDRQPKRLGFSERMRRLKSTSASSSAIVRASTLCDPSYHLGSQRDRQKFKSTIDKNPDFEEVVRARSKVVNSLTERIRSKTKANESAVSKTRVEEASGSRSVNGNDRDRTTLSFEEKMQRSKSTAASSSAIRSPTIRDDPFCDLGEQKDRQMVESTIEKSRDLKASARACSTIVYPLMERIRSGKTKANEPAVPTRGGTNREIESLYDERSAIADLNSTKPKRIFKTVETMHLIIEKTAIRDFPEDPRNRGDFSPGNRSISASRRRLPIIRSNVALPVGRINRIGNGRWKITQPPTSTQISR